MMPGSTSANQVGPAATEEINKFALIGTVMATRAAGLTVDNPAVSSRIINVTPAVVDYVGMVSGHYIADAIAYGASRVYAKPRNATPVSTRSRTLDM